MTTAYSRSHAQRHSFDAAAHAQVIRACQSEDRGFGDYGDGPASITEPWASDDDADHNERRDTAMGSRQHEAAAERKAS